MYDYMRNVMVLFLLPGLCFAIHHSMETGLTFRHIHKSRDAIIDCALKIIETNFIHTPTIIFNQNSEDETNKDGFNEKMTSELVRRNIPRILSQRQIDTESSNNAYNILMIRYLHQCESLTSLQKEPMDDIIKHLVIVFDYSKRCDTLLQHVVQNNSVKDVTYMLRHSDNKIDITTFIPQINPETCALKYDLPPILLSTCDYKESFNAFPNKQPQDYMQCPVNIGMASHLPFSNIPKRSLLKNYDYLSELDINGCDVELMKIFGKYFNFTPVFRYICSFEENPLVDVEFLKFVLNGSLDICAGGMYRVYGDVVDYSGSYDREVVVWMYTVNRGPRSWQGFVSKVDGLYIFIIFYIIYCITMILFCIYDKQAAPMGSVLLHTWGALIGTSSLKESITLKQKILNVVYLVMCIHLAVYINIQMYSFLTILSPPISYKTNRDLIKSGVQPYFMTKIKYFVTDEAYAEFASNAKNCESFLHCEEMAIKYDSATAVIDGMLTAFQAQTAVNDEARVLRVNENLLTVYHDILFRKDLSIKKSFQKVMSILRDAGITDRLYDEAIGILTKSKSKSATKNIMSYSYSCRSGCSITLEQSAGAFYAWMIGCALSFCVFVIEVMS